MGGLPDSRSIPVAEDDLGRVAVALSVARMLLTERREAEAEQARRRQEVERRMIEQDQLRQAQIWKGVPAGMIPADVHPATAMLQAALDARPRRINPLQEALSNSEGFTFHSLGPSPDEDKS